MSTGDPGRLERWQRREPLMLLLVPWVLLTLSAVGSWLANPPFTARELGGIALAAALLAGLHVARERRPAIVRAGFVALLVVVAALVVGDPTYGFFAFSGYLWAFAAFAGRVRLVGIVAVAGVIAISQVGGVPGDAGGWAAWVAVWCVNAAIAGAFTFFDGIAADLAAQRKRDVEELTAANARLEELLAENRALQAELVERARDAGVMDERARIAREIHDTIAQALTGVVAQVQSAARADAPAAERARHLDAALTLARDGLSEARRSVAALRPEALDGDVRLPEALGDVVARWRAVHAVPVTLTTTGDVRALGAETEVTLLRAAQEGLANVARHARAGRVGLTLSYMGDEISLDVRDDGVGFDPVARDSGSGGFGLVGMRERVTALGGTLEVESEPGAGTAISARVPA